jgi:ATP-dependent helicase/nuclease subunit A
VRSVAGSTGRRAADAEARRRAQHEFERPLLLEAGAGTGKTSVLVTRVLAWSLGPGWERAEAALARGPERADAEAIAARVLDRVVAVTFTEAAAAEMEERIARGLRALVEDGADWPKGLDAAAVPADPTLRRTRARALLAGFDRLRVSTIHAFCRRLLAEHPREADVHPRFTVDAAGMARAAAAREAVEGWLFESARDDDADLFALVEAGVAAPELEAAVDALLAAAAGPEQLAPDPLSPERIAALAARLRQAAEALLEAEAGALRRARRPTNGGKLVLAVEATAARMAVAPPDAAGLAARVGEIASLWPPALRTRLADFARGKVDTIAEHDALGDRAPDFCLAVAAFDPLLRHVLALDPERLARVHRLVAALHVRAAARMRREGAESFDALLRKASALVERHPSVTDRLRARIDQLLVDEFQDTDSAQCALVARLALAPGAPRPGLFVVGDPKQSIYGWRNADLKAYEDFRARLEQAGGEVHLLCVNYRSTPAVLDEVERALRPVMVAAPGQQPPFEPLLAGRAEVGPAVEYWIATDWAELCGEDGAKTEQRVATRREAERLASDLLRVAREAREAGAPLAWQRVGVLLRTTSDIEVYLAALRDAGIPYTVTRDRQYAQRREVVEARALVRAVLDPGDQVALVATLRAAWAGVPDAAWRPLWRFGFPDALRRLLDGRHDARERLRGVLRAAAVEVAREADRIPGLAALAGWDDALLHAAEVLAALRRSFSREPAERFVERLRSLPLLAAGEAARFLGPWRLANLERFHRELARLLEESRGDEAPVLRMLRREDALDADWDEGRPARPGDDAVQVMSIHGAKGLEFEHVYLLQVHKGEARDDWEPFRAGEGALADEWCLGGAKVATLGFDRVRAARRAIEENERVRTLYVAMTRAERRLVVSGHWAPAALRGVHGRLLATSRGEALEAALAAATAAGEHWDGSVSHDGARWLFLERAPALAEPRLASDAETALDLGRVRAESERLAALAAAAARRAERPLAAAVTAGARSEADEETAAQQEAADRARRRGPPAPDRATAAAVGTAIHAMLERLDGEAAEPDTEWEQRRAGVRAALERSLPPERLARAIERADELLERLRGGHLGRRLREIAPHVIARELPVLVEPEADAGPVGAGIGAIDLVYRDVAGGAVVVDFKTDRIDSSRALAERVEHHRAQANAYRRAVESVLGRARVELWFLDADRDVPVD